MRSGIRTGWVTDARRCPLHGDPLELWFDETDYSAWLRGSPDHVGAIWEHDENRIGWRCERCVGAWLENYFLAPSSEAPTERLIVACSACGSQRVTHTCVAACCGDHSCLDCGAGFDVTTRVVERGASAPVERSPRLAALVMSGPLDAIERTGHTRPFRPCPRDASHGLLELVLLERVGGAQPPLGWACHDCRCTWTETWFRPRRVAFVPEAEAAVQCAQCGREDVRPTSRGLVCRDCGALLALQIAALGKPPR